MLNQTDSIETAIRSVEMASRVTSEIQGQIHHLTTLHKDDRSPVTVADYAAQAVVIHNLRGKLGDIQMVAEESGQLLRTPTQQGLLDTTCASVRQVWPDVSEAQLLDCLDAGNHDASGNSYWTLDPVDGTKGFLRDGHYAISLALIQDGQVKLGVLGCPRLPSDSLLPINQASADGVLFIAVAGQGCWSRPLSAETETLTPCQSVPQAEGKLRFCESVETAHSDHDWSRQLASDLGCDYQSIQIDSQCKYGVVARGQADAYLRLPTRADYQEKIWDHAAGMLIAQEAGLRVTDIHNKLLDFSRGPTLAANQGVICATPDLHAQLMAAIKRMS